MSALLSGMRREGTDLVRRCFRALPRTDRAADSGLPELERSLSVASFNSFDSTLTAPVDSCDELVIGSEGREPPPKDEDPLVLLRCHTLGVPLSVKSRIKCISANMLTSHDWLRIPTAFKKRKGRIVKQYSQESRQASAPNHKTCSSCGGSKRKFWRRSILTRDDSYGNSLVTDLCMYNGDGRCEDSSSCK